MAWEALAGIRRLSVAWRVSLLVGINALVIVILLAVIWGITTQAQAYPELTGVCVAVMVIGAVFVALSIGAGLIIARSIRQPLRDLVGVMTAVAAGDFKQPISGTDFDDEIGALARALAVLRDNALNKRRFERELEIQERRWRTVLENSPIGISIVTGDALERLYVNPRYVELIGATDRAEAQAMPAERSFANPADLQALAERARRDGILRNCEVERLRLDGSSWWCMLDVRAIESDGLPAFLVWQYDITERRRAEVELRAAKERAEAALAELGTAQETLIQSEKMAALGGLVAGVAHEINTPLGISLTSASLLAEEGRRLSTSLQTGTLRKSDLSRFLGLASESSELMLTNCQRAADLIKSFKQVAVDQASEERRTFLLREYLDEILMSLGPRLKRTTVTVTVSCPDELELRGYPGPIAQLLTNFVINSLIHAFEPGQPGNITLTVRCPIPDQVELIYGDDGRGIPEDVLPKIFDPFFTTNRGGGGTGLGLNIVHTLVTQRLKGEIAVASHPGQGTIFTLRFPRVL